METAANNFGTTTHFNYVKEKSASANNLSKRYNRFIEDLKFSHFGLMVMAILIGSCLGSIAAMYLFMAGAPIWIFAIGLFASLANLVACIAQAPTKWVVNIFFLSVLINITLLAISPLL